jgi:hypothetical protein
MPAGEVWSVDVTAVDQFGNQWHSSDPDFVFQCLTCSSMVRTASTGGTSTFEAIIPAAGTHSISVYTSGQGQLVTNLSVAVTPAQADIFASSISGPLTATAGSSMSYTFSARDVFGNLSPMNMTDGSPLAFSAVLRKASAVAATEGDEIAAESVSLDSGAELYLLDFVTTVTGEYYVVVTMGSAFRGLQPEARHGPLQVFGAAPDAAQTSLLVQIPPHARVHVSA